MKTHIVYNNPENKTVREDFDTPGSKPPPNAYAAMGINGSRAGDLFMCRLARGGTSLIPLYLANGNRARTDKRHAGKTFIDGEWQNQ